MWDDWMELFKSNGEPGMLYSVKSSDILTIDPFFFVQYLLKILKNIKFNI